jgi:hypothetical protein
MNSDDDVYLTNSKIERWKIMVVIDTHLKNEYVKRGDVFYQTNNSSFLNGQKIKKIKGNRKKA